MKEVKVLDRNTVSKKRFEREVSYEWRRNQIALKEKNHTGKRKTKVEVKIVWIWIKLF